MNNSVNFHGYSMDANTSTAGQSFAAAQSESKPETKNRDVTVVIDTTHTTGKHVTTNVQTLNGNTVVEFGTASVESSRKNSQPFVNNGSGSILTPLTSAQNAATSPQSCLNSVATVTFPRHLMQTPCTSQSGGNSSTVLPLPAVTTTSISGAVAHKSDSGTHIASGIVSAPTVTTVCQTGPSTTAAPTACGIRAITPQVLAPRLAQPQQSAPNIQNIQLPAGMVLVRSESGQLLMIHQQTLAQIQAQSQAQSAKPQPVAPSSTPLVQLTSLQASGTSLLTHQVNSTTVKQGLTTMAPATTLEKPPVLQNTIMLGGTASSAGQPAIVQPGPAATAVTQRVGRSGTPLTPIAVTPETLENVKKCKNFLSTLIKLASSGKQTTETTANVKDLVKKLLESKIEAEDFTSKLYKELNSSPQPYLVPFLKRSLPTLRQMTTDSEAFIQQSLLRPPNTASTASTSTALTAVVLRPPLATAAVTSTAATKPTVISLSQTPYSKPGLIKPQQHGMLVRPQMAQSPIVTLRGQPHSPVVVGQRHVVKQLQAVPAVRHVFAPLAKGVQVISQVAVTATQKHKAVGGTFRDDVDEDDINDVASMAGVNLSEENARILASTSGLVGVVTRSCKGETFLSTSTLTHRALEIGRKFGVSDLGTDVINYISHATQQRLQNLLGKTSLVAQQKNITFKEDKRHEQISDVRAQLKFFEQLDQMEKQRKEEQEREILLKAAKSRSRQEDPEQARLKQKAKEMQQQELAQIQQREANLTALAAIGPRKRKIDFPIRGVSAESVGSCPAQPGGSSVAGSRQFTRQRTTRVNLRELLFCLENEKDTSHSELLYRGFLK